MFNSELKLYENPMIHTTQVDLMIPMHVKDILTQIFAVIGSVFVICFANPTIIVAIVPMVVVFFVVQGGTTEFGGK